jgi:hypothetical protein
MYLLIIETMNNREEKTHRRRIGEDSRQRMVVITAMVALVIVCTITLYAINCFIANT